MQRYSTIWMLVLLFLLLPGCSSSPKKKPVKNVLDQPPPEPKVGMAFRYKHSGPRPWGNGTEDATGERIVMVTHQNEKGLWGFEELFEKDPGTQITYCDKNYMIQKQVLLSNEDEVHVNYSKPIPLRHLKLKEDEEETVESKQTIIDAKNNIEIGTAVISVKTTRKRDERLITEAGAILCRHFESHTTIQANFEQTTVVYTVIENTYWNDQIGWFVREELRFEPIVYEGTLLRVSYQTVSELIDYEQMSPNDIPVYRIDKNPSKK